MLKTLGVTSIEELIGQTVPDSILSPGQLTFGPALTETGNSLLHALEVAAKNKVLTSLIGQGYYGTRNAPQSFQPEHPRETLPGTPPTRPTSRRSARAGSKPSSTSRPWSPISPASTSPTPHCSTKPRQPPKRWPWPSAERKLGSLKIQCFLCRPELPPADHRRP